MHGAIRNVEAIGRTPARADVLSIAEAGLAAVQVAPALARAMRIEHDELIVMGKRYTLAGRRVFFVGVGKCALAGAEAIEELLGERISGGIALDVRGLSNRQFAGSIQVFAGTHPKPSDANLEAAARIVELLDLCDENDLVLMLVSGGGSTLLCLHDAPMTCLEESMIFDALTAKGARIEELNLVRKHLSLARGGGLAKAAYPAEVVALVVSDIPGNDIRFVASGPSVRDDSTIADASVVLERYGIAAPPGSLLETPKEDRYFERVENMLFLSNRDALEAMQGEAARLGYKQHVVGDAMRGEAREVAKSVADLLHAAPPGTAYLWGGETTVTLAAGSSAPLGVGGRNQELALAALQDIRAGELMLPFASDGKDATDFAGAIADDLTLEHARSKGLSIDDALARHASFDFFKATGDGLETGLLGSNVSDLLIGIKS